VLVAGVVEEESLVFFQGVNLGAFKGFRGPGVNYFKNGIVSNVSERCLVDSRFHTCSPFDKACISDMFIMEIGDVIIDDQIDEGVFDVGMGVIDPGVHFFSDFTKLGVDDGAVGSLDVLPTGEEDGLPFHLRDGYLALFETAKAYLMGAGCRVVVLSVSEEGLESGSGRG